MNAKRNSVRVAALLALAAVAALGCGCGGIGASGSVSPATFLLPGLMQADPPKTDESPASLSYKPSPQIAANDPVR